MGGFVALATLQLTLATNLSCIFVVGICIFVAALQQLQRYKIEDTNIRTQFVSHRNSYKATNCHYKDTNCRQKDANCHYKDTIFKKCFFVFFSSKFQFWTNQLLSKCVAEVI